MKQNIITHPKEYPKVWGKEIWIANTKLYCSKILLLEKNKRCSIHYHKIKDETFYILSGKVKMEIWPKGYPGEAQIFNMIVGDTVHITQNLPHRFTGIDENSEILEVSTQHFEEDSYRYVPSGALPEK